MKRRWKVVHVTANGPEMPVGAEVRQTVGTFWTRWGAERVRRAYASIGTYEGAFIQYRYEVVRGAK